MFDQPAALVSFHVRLSPCVNCHFFQSTVQIQHSRRLIQVRCKRLLACLQEQGILYADFSGFEIVPGVPSVKEDAPGLPAPGVVVVTLGRVARD